MERKNFANESFRGQFDFYAIEYFKHKPKQQLGWHKNQSFSKY